MVTRSRSRRAPWAPVVAVCAAVLLAACSSSSHSSSQSSVPATTAPSTSTSSSAAPSQTVAAPRGVTWMTGFAAPGTPAQYNKVGVIKVGPSAAKNVLVLEPGTSAGSAYFVPLAKWIVATAPGWQVWSVERRENLLEDQSELDRFKQGKSTATELYNYYLGYLKNPAVKQHFKTIPDSTVEFAKQWGMAVAVQDLHTVIGAAQRLGGKVVLGGHSLGGSVVTAYATWDFGGQAGADDLAGLVYIDGGSGDASLTAQQATQTLQAFEAPNVSPWLNFGGIAAPYAGLFNASGSAAALLAPNQPSLGQTSGLLPASIVPPVRASNVGQYGYALNVATSPANLAAAQAHLGTGLTASGPVHGWNGTGALTPISRYSTMFSGAGLETVDGTEWYFPQRLTDDTGVVDNGNANPAQSVLGVDATMGHKLPTGLLIYAFGAHLGGARVLDSARALAAQSNIPAGNLTLVNRQSTYAHNDPAGAYPANAFFQQLIPFLAKVSR
jgi:pimeloyl-ACP methyl ester carboxylesterase